MRQARSRGGRAFFVSGRGARQRPRLGRPPGCGLDGRVEVRSGVDAEESTRFVVLHHKGHGDPHWDLMIERGGFLETWRLPLPRPVADSLAGPAERIGDHRPAYLDYEGPIGGGRGDVQRLAGGEMRILCFGEAWRRFRIPTGRFSGDYLLERNADGPLWVLSVCRAEDDR